MHTLNMRGSQVGIENLILFITKKEKNFIITNVPSNFSPFQKYLREAKSKPCVGLGAANCEPRAVGQVRPTIINYLINYNWVVFFLIII